MSFDLLLFLSFLCVLSSSLCDEGSVVQYSSLSFAQNVGNNNHFVMFYAPWCGHCKRLLPVWEQLAEVVGKDSQVTIAKVDCTAEHELCSTQDITGYPTLKLFKPNSEEATKYRGTRDLESLKSFLSEQIGGVHIPPEPSVALVDLTDENYEATTSVGSHFVKFFAPWCGHCQKLAPTWEQLATSLEHNTDVKVSRVDCTVHRTVCNGLDIKGYPTLLFIRDGVVVEKYSGHRSLEDLQAFAQKMVGVADTTKVPGGPLLSAETFADGVSQGVTFVKFFAPWCGHCKRLAPVWNELGVRLATASRVQLSRVDCTQTGSRDLCNEQEVEGFPTLLVYKNGEKVSEYNGSRNVDDMYQFLAKYFEHDEL